MGGPEQKIQTKIIKFLKSLDNIYIIKTIATTKKGVPDIICCYNGYFLGLEVKTPATKTNVSPLQKVNIEDIIKAGGYAVTVWEVEQVKSSIVYIDKMAKGEIV